MNKIYHIGCSGYYYSYWKNRFYPTGVQSKNWLEYYSSVFNTVELNGTFYRTPKLTDLKKYQSVTPADFKFSVKVSKYITHIIKLKESKQQINDFQDLISRGLENKVNFLLFQFPPSFHYNEENLERIINNIPHKQKNVIEFRHISWWNDDVQNALQKAKLTFCNVDYPGLETNFIHTTDTFYLRLHGNPELFKSSYSTGKLIDFFEKFPTHSKEYSVFFNNTYYEAGYKNALVLINIIKNN